MAEATIVSVTDTILPDSKLKFEADLKPGVLNIAQRMCESYLGKTMPAKRLIVTYTISEANEALPAVADYPILVVTSVHNSTRDSLEYTHNDEYIVGMSNWTNAPLSVVYVSGLPVQVYDAVLRQARMLNSRPNFAPELENLGIEGIDPKFNPSMRSGLSPDVKQMLFPYKVVGF